MEIQTILIIDDEPSIRESYSDYLEDMEYKTLTAENGRIGLDIFQKHEVDLVLVDMRMPEMDGLEVLSKITKRSPNTPSIIISGAGLIGDAVEALHRGAWDYLLKPIEDFSVLLHAVTNALEKARLKRENQKYQKNLEYMVLQRTRKLEQANFHLFEINERLKAIVETTRRLSSCREVEQFDSLLLHEFARNMSAAGGSMYFKEREGLHLVDSLDSGHAPEFISFPLRKNCLFQYCISKKEPVLIQNIEKENFAKSGWKGYRDSSSLLFPLINSSDEITGILSLHNKKETSFVEQDKEIGSLLATYSCEALRAVRATESLKNSELRFRSILDNIRTGIIITELETETILYANPSASKMIGESTEKIIGTKSNRFLSQINSSDQKLKTVEGKEIPILITTSQTFFQGKNCRLKSFIDLTAQKKAMMEKQKLESQLRQAQKLKALGELAGGVAHDFNNMLAGVIGATELLQDSIAKEHKSRKYIDMIMKTSDQAADLTRKLLAFSRRSDNIAKPLDCHNVINDSLSILKHCLDKRVEIITSFQAKNTTVMANATALQNVFINLGVNAGHAMPKGGILSIRTREVYLDKPIESFPYQKFKKGSYIKISIEDNGCGMHEEILERVFEPFFTTKEKGIGTGLGLPAVYGTVNEMLGYINISSEVGKGSIFEIYLPLAKNILSNANFGTTRRRIEKESATILLVEDDEIVRSTSCTMLEKLGYKVIVACNGREGLDSYKQHRNEIDLVLLDMVMPEMNGTECFRALKKENSEVKVVLTSGFSRSSSLDNLLSEGCCIFLKKPYRLQALAKTIKNILKNS